MRELEEGEVLCSKCLGKGYLNIEWDDDLLRTCPKCNGIGVLDWIENVMGKYYIPIDVFSSDPDGSVDLYYEGNKLLKTTKSGGIKFYTKGV